MLQKNHTLNKILKYTIPFIYTFLPFTVIPFTYDLLQSAKMPVTSTTILTQNPATVTHFSTQSELMFRPIFV